MQTRPKHLLTCDGCGQPATPEHIARRLERLEWSTRYRPVHIGALLLGAISPLSDVDFLYSGQFEGEAGRILEAVGIIPAGRSAESVLSEFQRCGFFLAHVLECPLEDGEGKESSCERLLAGRLSSVLARIRRSLKPKKVILVSGKLEPVVGLLNKADLECPVILDGEKPFGLDTFDPSGASKNLRGALSGAGSGK
ncbi:MAG: hypothetical protein WCE61_20415 [Candidatus Acidiferrum sp.]